MKTFFSRTVLWSTVALVGMIGIWAALAATGVLFPQDGAHLHLNCGKQEYDYVTVVVHENSGDAALYSYGWKLTYFRFLTPGLRGTYPGKPVTKDIQWRPARSYSIIARDRAGEWFQWRLSEEDVAICNAYMFGGKTVTITVPVDASATTPPKDYLASIGIPADLRGAQK